MKKNNKLVHVLLALVLCCTFIMGSTFSSCAAKSHTYSKTKTVYGTHYPVVVQVTVTENASNKVTSKKVECLNSQWKKSTLKITIPKKGYCKVTGNVYIDGVPIGFGDGCVHEGKQTVHINTTFKYK